MGSAGYLSLYRRGKLREQVEIASSLLERCSEFPRECGANRLGGEMGRCRTSLRAMVSSYGPHFGEEAPLVGGFDSGTIFLTDCNFGCVFGQNSLTSQLGQGERLTKEELAYIMPFPEAKGCHNMNLVSPSHNATAQYHPSYKAFEIPGLGQGVSSAEYHEALSFALEGGLSPLHRIQPAEFIPIVSE